MIVLIWYKRHVYYGVGGFAGQELWSSWFSRFEVSAVQRHTISPPAEALLGNSA